MAETNPNKILEVRHLNQFFNVGKADEVKAVNDVSFDIYRGETFGLVGESGSGKTTTGRAILQLYKPTSGEIIFNGKNINSLTSKKQQQHFRRQMQMIFQDPYASLNPRMKVQDIVEEGIDINHLSASKAERNQQVAELLETVGLNKDHASRYPHEFSGGQRQRIGIARALAVNPDFIICDEPISALDVSIQAQVVNLLKELQEKQGLTYLFIAHDLSMVKYISDRIGVMHYGKMLEIASADEIYSHPLHDYTRSLLSAIPIPDPRLEKARTEIIYNPQNEDAGKKRELIEILPNHYVRAAKDEVEMYRNRALESVSNH